MSKTIETELNGIELRALRNYLNLTVGDCAEFISYTSKRTWQYWESGRSKVPSDIQIAITRMVKDTKYIIEKIKLSYEKFCKSSQSIYCMATFQEFKDYGEFGETMVFDELSPEPILKWFSYEAAVAHVFAELICDNENIGESSKLDEVSPVFIEDILKCVI
jgi:hypothetical protein